MRLLIIMFLHLNIENFCSLLNNLFNLIKNIPYYINLLINYKILNKFKQLHTYIYNYFLGI